jgi:hypothetical protein
MKRRLKSISLVARGISGITAGKIRVGALTLGLIPAAQVMAADSPDWHPQQRLALAADAQSGSGGHSAEEEESAEQAELVKKTLNPVADLISVPIQNNWDFGIGSADAMKYTANIQPVIPISLNKDWNLITRTILPVIYEGPRFSGDSSHSGLGDTLQSFFLSPKQPVGGWIVGAGPALLYPTGWDPVLGSGKWGAGPTVVLLRQEKGFTYGILANQVWSYAGWGSQNVNNTFLQPFFSYSTKTYTSFGVNTESTYDWQLHQWSVPLNFTITQLIKIGKQPLSLQLGYRYYADGPQGGPDWGLRFTVTMLFPKH